MFSAEGTAVIAIAIRAWHRASPEQHAALSAWAKLMDEASHLRRQAAAAREEVPTPPSEPSTIANDVRETARAIVRMGKIRRSEIVVDEQAPPQREVRPLSAQESSDLAARVIAAASKARGAK